MLSPRRSPARLVDVEKNANVATNIAESRVDDMPDDDDDWNFESAVGLEEVERAGVKRIFRDFQESCRFKLRKVPGTVAEAVELAKELVKQVGEPGVQVANNGASVAIPSGENQSCVALGHLEDGRRGKKLVLRRR